MFTLGACFAVGLIGWWADRCNIKDRQSVSLLSDDEVRQSVLHARQDLKLIAFLMMAIVVMLGVIADRVH
jgi:hypothetical protein